MPCYHAFFEESGHLLRDYRLFRPNPTFRNTDWEAAPLRALVVRLSPYRDVDRSTAHLALFRELRRAVPGCWVDFAFLPVAADRALFERAGLPLLLGTQSHRSVDEFDLALVSNSCLPEIVNLPGLLRRSSIPVWARDRDERWPVILLGGSNAAAAHAAIAPDGSCMADGVFFGEAEGELEAIVGRLAGSRGRPKQARLAETADGATGLWPSGDLARTVRRAAAGIGLLDRQSEPAPVLPGPEAGTARLEISRGCPCRCSFCFEGLDRLPFREVPVEDLARASLRLRASSGAGTLELSSLNFNTHSGIADLLRVLLPTWRRVNPMSQRVDILARSPALVELELAADKRTFTLGIEGVSSRLRSFLHKSLGDAEITKAMELLHRPGVRELKLFYLITAHEEEADFAELAAFARWLKGLRQRAEAKPRLVFSFGMLVRMPFTPLRYDPFPGSEEPWRRLVGRAKSIVETNGFEFRLAMGWLDWMFSQLLASGDHRLHGLLELLASEGILWDRELPAAARGLIDRWMSREGLSLEELGSEKPADHPFPMRQLQGNPSAELLWRRYLEAKAHVDRGYGRPGAGTSDSWRASIARATGELARQSESRRKLGVVHLRVQVPMEAAGLGAEWLDAWLTRELFAAASGLAATVLVAREELVRLWYGERCEFAWYGLTLAAVAGVEEGEPGIPGFESSPADAAGVASLAMRVTLPRPHFPEATERFAAWLRAGRVPATFLRTADGMRLELPPAYLKRTSILSASWREAAEGLEIRLEARERFDLEGMLGSLAEEAAARRRALVEITGLSQRPPANAVRSPRGSPGRAARR